MKNFWGYIAAAFLCVQAVSWANSVSLFNDTQYMLKATIYDANGNLLGEFVLNPRDASDWSDNDMNFGTESQYAAQVPYTVNWNCMSGGAYGTCNNVAAGSVVTAQSCGGNQECQQQQQNGY